jgi:protein SCO1/2
MRRGALLVLGAVAAMIVYALIMRSKWLTPPPKELAVLGHVPEMILVDQSGAPFTAASMRGRVWISDFIFTTCQSTCPGLTAKMRRLQDVLAKDEKTRGARLVSFSVDPENDTPEVLAAYAAKAGADPKVWSFVTGKTDAMRAAVVGGFKMTAEREGANVVHGNWFILGDAEGNIRGYYEAETDEDVETIARDAARLALAP